MINRIFKLIAIAICLSAIILSVQSAKAAPIREISIPMLGATYDYSDRSFEISGLTDVEVFYTDSTSTSYQAFFLMYTTGLDWEISNMGKNITYTISAESGIIDLQEYENSPPFFTPLLTGDLLNLEMTIIDPTMGMYEGTGEFFVTGGDLAEDFGDDGGFAAVGLAFRIPNNFRNSFTSMANTTLYPAAEANPTQTYPSPEPSTVITFVFMLIGIGWIVKKQQVKE